MNTKKNQHTPGPWHVEPKVSDHGASLVICSEGKDADILAVIPPMNDADEPDFETAKRGPSDEANAELMAAAPELLDMLETMKEHMEEAHYQDMVMENDGASSGAERQHKNSEPDCSYCKAIAEAKALLKRHGR